MSVVDGRLKVYGVDNLRIADASILPRVTTGNTTAPCVVIGERAAAMILTLKAGERRSAPAPKPAAEFARGLGSTQLAEKTTGL